MLIKFIRSLSTNCSKPLYVTTPIFYVNAGMISAYLMPSACSNAIAYVLCHLLAPHIGHLYSAVISDCIVRYEKLRQRHSRYLFSTGTDEHGTKIQQAAKTHNQPLHAYCTDISDKYSALFRHSNIDYTHFNRTSDKKQHFGAVEHFWVSGDPRHATSDDKWISICLHCRMFCTREITFIRQRIRDGTACQMKCSSQIHS